MNATLQTFVSRLADAPDASLRFLAEDTTIRPEYHVTEVRTARVSGLDCGGRHSAWDETIIELLDGPDPSPPSASFMTAGTFAKIAIHGQDRLPDARSARLYFEYAPGNGPMRRYEVRDIRRSNSGWIVDLAAVRAACKPAREAAAVRVGSADSQREPDAGSSIADAACCGQSNSKTRCCAQ